MYYIWKTLNKFFDNLTKKTVPIFAKLYYILSFLLSTFGVYSFIQDASKSDIF